eukprot:CAMPEP_0184659100 /NCGR_PEP_ID=MMETSP0308-20130426/28185_1 /TAXON_ID=38269 /ORGANISM="Gloeochaete witrockiana, Strain SAG 46.84" /LENGTH=350 /DNA_ID=CAMNT_0027098633 /DNA_START=105 /DNA_END=1154 /DNA_ORIENTATION=-
MSSATYDPSQPSSRRRISACCANEESSQALQGLVPWQHMVAGAAAGTAEHCIMFPVDTIKTRLQALRATGSMYESIWGSMRHIWQEEGMRRMWRGVSTMMLIAGPVHALYFATYEKAKESLGGNKAEHNPLAHAAAGVAAIFVHDLFMTPADVIKQRMQLSQSVRSSMFTVMRSVYRAEGIGAFFASYPTTVVMSIPSSAVYFASYESARRFLDPENKGGAGVDVMAGGIAGATASALTNPLDVIKTRLQTQGGLESMAVASSGCSSCTPRPLNADVVMEASGNLYLRATATDQTVCMGRKYHGLVDTARTILQEEGWRAFFKGLRARVVISAPAAAITWGTYEFMKRLW